MNHLSLFSGIGGLDLAAEWAGFRTVAFVEREPFCRAVLGKRWPGVPIIGDVREVAPDAPRYVRGQPASAGAERERARVCGAQVGIVSGGFPCQPHSVAGKRGASGDERDLWPEFARIIGALRPRWVVAENVPGLLTSERGAFFAGVLQDLAALGYRAGWGCWRASDVGALHRRERVFVVAHADAEGELQPRGLEREERGRSGDSGAALADAIGERGRGRHSEREDAEDAWESSRHSLERIWNAEPAVGRVADGVPGRVHRLRALGNAVVPQQAYPLFKAIADYEMNAVHSACTDRR